MDGYPCVVCAKIFEPRKETQKTCSRSCFQKHNRATTQPSSFCCEICGIDFTRKPKGSKKFCSEVCKAERARRYAAAHHEKKKTDPEYVAKRRANSKRRGGELRKLRSPDRKLFRQFVGLTEAEHEKIQQRAKEAGVTPSDLIRLLLQANGWI